MEGFEGLDEKNKRDKIFLEMKDMLSDEDVHPGVWYNEFGENKVIQNSEKVGEGVVEKSANPNYPKVGNSKSVR